MEYPMAMKKVIVGLLPLVLLAGSMHAGAQATTGSISGRVADPQGSVVSGANVSIQDVDTGVISTAVTNQSGEFIVTALPPLRTFRRLHSTSTRRRASTFP
jgi:hypothetical protein